MKTYLITVLDGTTRGYSASVQSHHMEVRDGFYRFYNIVDNTEINISYYPICRTIINKIDINGKDR